MTRVLESSRAALVALALVVLGFIVTLNRVPVLWNDDALYASVARSVQQHGDGTPSILRGIPGTPDHESIYGPVFFRLAAWSFGLFGFSLGSFRAVSLLGAFIIAGAAIHLASTFGLSRAAGIWRAVMLLLAPSVGGAATNGRMDTIAVGLSMAGLSALVAGVAVPERRTATRGAVAGICFLLAALTTPRGLPFAGTCALGLVVLAAVAGMDKPFRRMTLATAGAFVAGIVVWDILSRGEFLGWMRALAAVVPNLNEEIAFAEGATRDWWLAGHEWTLAFLVAGLPITALSTWHIRRERPDVRSALRHAALFAIGVTWMNMAVVFAVANLTFVFAIFFAAPMLAVAVALPQEWLPLSRANAARIICAILVVFAAGRTAKYALAAATWSARDPRGLREFTQRHVPPGGQVIGRARWYLFAVERAGAKMVSLSGESFASWTKVGEPPPNSGSHRSLAFRVSCSPA